MRPGPSFLDDGQADLLAAVIGSTPDAIFVEDLDGRLVFANEPMARFFGRPAQALVGLTERDLFPPDLAEAMIADNGVVLATREVRTIEERVQSPDGRDSWASVTKGPMRDAHGRISGLFGIVRDITELRRLELEAHELRSAIEQSGAAFSLTGLDGLIRYMNPAARRLFGIGPTEGVAGQPSDRYYADRAEFDQWSQAITGGGVAEVEIVGLRSDGTTVPLLGSASIVRDAEGAPAYVVVTHTDLTAIRCAEAALRASEQALVEAQLVGRTGSWTWDAVRDVSTWSAEMHRLLLVDADESPISLATLEQRLDHADAGRVRAAIAEALQERRPFELEFRATLPDGREILALARGAPDLAADGSVLALHGTLTDLTELRRAEAAAQDLKAAIDQSAASVSLASLDGRTLYANAAARRLFGGPGADLDREPRDGASFYTDPAAFGRWKSATEASGSAQAELTAVRPDGTRVDLLCSASIVRDAGGRPRFVVASHVDLTGIRRAEAALRASETALIEAQRVGRTGSWTYDADSGTATWSAQVQRIAGLAPGRGEAPAAFLNRWLGEAGSARARAAIDLTLADGSDRDLELHWRRAPADPAWAVARFVADRDARGRIMGVHGTLTDISDLRRAEQVARNLKAAIDGSAVSFAIADLAGHTIYANDAARRLFGVDPTAATEGPQLDSIVDKEPFLRHQRDAWEHGYAQAELTARRADGTVFQVLGTSSIIRDEDGRPVQVASSHLDLSDLRRAEAAEREAEEHARRTVSSINGIIRYKARANSPTVVSPQVREILGYEPGEVADGEAWAAIIHPDDLGLHLATRVAHPDRSNHDYRIRRRDGAWLWVRQSTRGMRTPDGAKDGFVAVVTDISAHKAAEAEVQASVTRLRRFIDSNMLGVVISEVGGRILEANDYYLRVVGRTRAELEDAGLDWRAMTPPDFAAVDAAAVGRTIREGSAPAREKAYLRPDGSLAPVLISHALIGGEPLQIASFVVDLTERHEAERRIRESEERLHAALDAMLDPFVIASVVPGADDRAPDLRVEFANEAFAAVAGRPAEEIIGGPVPAHAVEVEGRTMQEIGLEVMAGHGHWRRDAADYTSARHPAGTGGLVSMQVAAFDHGFFATWRDVTELEHGRTERERLAAAVEQTIDMVLVTDAAGKISFVNAAFAALSRLAPEALVGQPARPILHDVVGPATADLLDAAARDGQPLTSEYSTTGAGGERRHFEVSLTPIRDPDRRVTSVVMVTRDITDQREAERGLLLEADLRRILAFTLQRVAPDAHAEEIAGELCDGLASRDGIDFVAVLAATTDGLRPIATRGAIDFTRPGVEFGSLADHLRLHGTSGPWATLSDSVDHDARVCRALTRAGIHAAAFGPIVHGDHADGVLMIGTYDAELAPTFVRRMPEVGDFSNTPSALLAGHLHGLRESLATQATLTEVMARSAWEVLFQPIVDMASGLPVGYEALTRFASGQRADLEFGSAWQVGMGEELELATLRAALAEGRKLPSGRWLDLNVSPRLFDDRDRLAALLSAADRPVVLEITEHEAIRDYAAIRNVVSSISAEVRLAVDDAGAGVANFSHIVELRADFVKLDIGLVRGINANFARQALVNGMRHFSRTTGCRLIAEGIETPEELATLTTLGIEYGQGYLFGRPAPADAWGLRPARPLGLRGKTAGQPVRRRRAGPLRGGPAS